MMYISRKKQVLLFILSGIYISLGAATASKQSCTGVALKPVVAGTVCKSKVAGSKTPDPKSATAILQQGITLVKAVGTTQKALTDAQNAVHACNKPTPYGQKCPSDGAICEGTKKNPKGACPRADGFKCFQETFPKFQTSLKAHFDAQAALMTFLHSKGFGPAPIRGAAKKLGTTKVKGKVVPFMVQDVTNWNTAKVPDLFKSFSCTYNGFFSKCVDNLKTQLAQKKITAAQSKKEMEAIQYTDMAVDTALNIGIGLIPGFGEAWMVISMIPGVSAVMNDVVNAAVTDVVKNAVNLAHDSTDAINDFKSGNIKGGVNNVLAAGATLVSTVYDVVGFPAVELAQGALKLLDIPPAAVALFNPVHDAELIVKAFENPAATRKWFKHQAEAAWTDIKNPKLMAAHFKAWATSVGGNVEKAAEKVWGQTEASAKQTWDQIKSVGKFAGKVGNLIGEGEIAGAKATAGFLEGHDDKAIDKGLSTAGKDIAGGAKKLGSEGLSGLESLGGDLGINSSSLGALSHEADSISGAASSDFNKAKQTANRLADDAKKDIDKGVDAVKGAAKKVGHFFKGL